MRTRQKIKEHFRNGIIDREHTLLMTDYSSVPREDEQSCTLTFYRGEKTRKEGVK